ncbi:glycosyltransferase family 4 protein [Thioclava kandeliae]|uniref:Glycosyltransferase family 4 protein n=1 Tax=Thioclava kandeliae TaxID=3070818 RepID=A0ABV1SLK4_9RHOB
MPIAPIAYLTGEYPKVSHTFIQREIEALRARGWQVEACTIRRAPAKAVVGEAQTLEASKTFCVIDAAKSPKNLIGAHFKMIRRDASAWRRALKLAWKTRPPGLKAALWQFFYFLEAGVLAKYLLDRNVVHLHNHFANSSCSVAMLASEMSGIPFSVTMHGPAIFYEPKWWRIDAKIARAAFVSCISHFCRSQAMYFSDAIHWRRLKIVHCGVRPSDYGRDPARLPAQEIIFVGRLAAIKGVPLLIDAFAAIADRHPQARLSIVGDGTERNAAEAQVARLGINERVRFLGYQPSDAVADLMRQSDLLVLPSFAEGVPVTLMEGMASGIPVIGSRVAGVQELVEDGVSGFVIAPGDMEGLIARLDQLLSDPELRERLGQAGRIKVMAEFDQDLEASWFDEILQGSIAGKLPDGLRPHAHKGTEIL